MRATSWLVRLVLGAAATCAIPGGAAAQEYGEVGEREWLMGAPADYPEANAVVVFDRANQVVGLDKDGYYPRMEFRRHVRMKVLTRAGADEVGSAEFSYYRGNNITEVRAQTVCPDGSVYEIPPEGFHVKQVGRWRTQSFAFPHADSGCIVEYTYKMYGENFMGFDTWYFSHGQYTIESSYSIEMDRGFGYLFRTRNIPDESRQPIKTEGEGMGDQKGQRFTWRMTNLRPVRSEPYMDFIDEFMASVQVRFTKLRTQFRAWDAADSWPKLAMQFEPYIEKFMDKPRDFKRDLRAIVRDCATDYEKSKALYQYVVDSIETRPEGYSLSIEHDKLSKVWQEKFGTAMEKNLLLVRMLKESGIKAWLILICTRDQVHLDPAWLNLDQFSHILVFAEVEQGGIYLDATSKYNAYGTLPPACRVSSGLMLDGPLSELATIVTNEPASSRTDMVAVHLDEWGSATCTTAVLCTGYLTAAYGRAYETSEPDDFVEDDILNMTSEGYRRGGFEAQLDSLHRFRVVTDYSIEAAGRRMEENLVVDVVPGVFARNPFVNEKRSFPINFEYPFTYRSIVHLIGPEGSTAASAPPDTAFMVDGLMYQRSCSTDGADVQIRSTITIGRPEFGVAEYDRVKEFFIEVEKAAAEKVVFAVMGGQQ